MPAQLCPETIQNVVASFPFGGGWKHLECSTLRDGQDSAKRRWTHVRDLRTEGGVYAFLAPVHFFAAPRTIHLHGPGGIQIPFEFTLPGLSARPELGVVYAGKSSNLSQRIQFHFALGDRNYGGQVKHALVDCGIAADEVAAVLLMLAHAHIVFHELPGQDNAANRDVIELTLCAKYMPPFNIKSER